MAHAMPPLDGPDLIVPGRIDGHLSTLQIINAAGERRMLRGSVMVGAAHRFAMGRETWVAEEFATALSIRAALRFLGRSVTVLLDFAASNVARVAKAAPDIIAGNHDAHCSHLGDPGAGKYCGRQSGRIWVMPPPLGEHFNDWHRREGLWAVAAHLQEEIRR